MDIFRNLTELMVMGGPIMIPISILAAWMWILILLQLDWIWRVRRRPLSVTEALKCLQHNEKPALTSACPKAGALGYFLQHHFMGRDQLCGDPDHLFFEVAMRRQMRTLYRHTPTIMVLAATAPLLGLLGTVSGMVETFRVIGLYGMGNAQAMAAGIKEALITTQAGLLVAIPGLLAGQALRKKLRSMHNDMLIFQRAVSQWLEKEWRQCSVLEP